MLGFLVIGACDGDGPAPRDGRPAPATGETGTSPPPPGYDGCNGRDDDLDGLIDEDGATDWWPDGDGDGFGGPGDPLHTCDPGEGWAAEPGDCDDTDSRLAGALDPVQRFVDRSEERGFVALGRTWDGQRVCLRDSLGGGVAVADLDGDGHDDVFVARDGLPHQLLRGDGRGGFATEELTELPPIRASGASPIDVDGDGALDLVVGSLGTETLQLLMNDGAGHFVDEAAARGVLLYDDLGGCGDWFGVSAADVDGDFDLDLFVGGWEDGLALGRRSRSRLLVNDGTGHFVDATASRGLDETWNRAVFGGLFTDPDGDGDPDLLVVADWNGTTTFENVGGRFVKAADESVFTDDNGMGADLGDPDGDGDLDWFLTSIWSEPEAGCSSNPASDCSGNRMYGWDRGWVDATDRANVREGQWDWGTTFLDLDLDGHEDLAFTGGFDNAVYRTSPGGVLHNRGDGTFEDWTCRTGFTWKGLGRGLLAFDPDEDGDQDLVLSGKLEGVSFFEWVGPPGHALRLELRQGGPNPFAIGALVRVRTTAESPPQVALIHANPRYTSGRGPWVHLGLGAHDGPVAEVEVTWPDGGVTRFVDVPQGRVVLRR